MTGNPRNAMVCDAPYLQNEFGEPRGFFFYVFNIILSFSTCSQSFKKIWTWEILGANVLNYVVCNPCQSSPSLTILVPLWFIIISLMFFYLCKVLLSDFLQIKGNFVDGKSYSKYREGAPVKKRS